MLWLIISVISIVICFASIVMTSLGLANGKQNWKIWFTAAISLLVVFFISFSNYQIYKQAEAAIISGKSLFSQSRYEEAIKAFEQVNPKSSLYSESLKLIDEALFSRGKQQFERNFYRSAVEFLSQIESESPRYPEAQSIINQAKIVEVEALIADGKQHLAKGEYLDAYNSLTKIDNSFEQYGDIKNSLLYEARTKYAQQLFVESKALAAKNDLDGAKSKLNSALSFYPSLPGGKAYLAEIEKKQNAYINAQKQKEADNYKNSCKTIEYRVLNKNPDSYAGTRVKLRGEIMQIMENAGSTFMLLQVTYTDYGYGMGSWKDTVAVSFDGTFNAYDDDVITIWGEVKGSYSYESVAGFLLTVPSVKARYVQYPKH